MYSFLFLVYVFVFIFGAAKVGQKQKSVCCVIFPEQGFFSGENFRVANSLTTKKQT